MLLRLIATVFFIVVIAIIFVISFFHSHHSKSTHSTFCNIIVSRHHKVSNNTFLPEKKRKEKWKSLYSFARALINFHRFLFFFHIFSHFFFSRFALSFIARTHTIIHLLDQMFDDCRPSFMSNEKKIDGRWKREEKKRRPNDTIGRRWNDCKRGIRYFQHSLVLLPRE